MQQNAAETGSTEDDGARLTPLAYNARLDGLRCIAVIWVVLHNMGNRVLDESNAVFIRLLDVALGTGWMGVQLFFVLSGYLITRILLASRGTEGALRIFFLRRVLRIFPVYFLLLALMIFVVPLSGIMPPGWAELAARQQTYLWTYTINWVMPFFDENCLPHLWSLGVEEQFYLFWPLLVLFLPITMLPRLFVALIVIATVVRSALFLGGDTWMMDAGYYWTITRIDALAAGGLLAWFTTPGRNGIPRAWLAGMTVSAAVAMLAIIGITHEFASSKAGISLLNQTIAGLLFFGVIGLVTMPGPANRVSSLLASRPMASIGRISYGIYLFHLPVIQAWTNLNPLPMDQSGNIARFAAILVNLGAVTVISVVIAAISWTLFERPILSLKRFLRYARQASGPS